MKMFAIVYSWAFDDVVIAAIMKRGVHAYTKWTEVLGCGSETGPRLSSRFRPGEDDVLTDVINNEDAERVKEVVLQLTPRTNDDCALKDARKDATAAYIRKKQTPHLPKMFS